MATVIKQPVNMTTEVQLRPGSVLAVASALIAITGLCVGAFGAYRAMDAEAEAIRLRDDNVVLRERVAHLEGQLERDDGLFSMVGLRKIPQWQGGPDPKAKVQ